MSQWQLFLIFVCASAQWVSGDKMGDSGPSGPSDMLQAGEGACCHFRSHSRACAICASQCDHFNCARLGATWLHDMFVDFGPSEAAMPLCITKQEKTSVFRPRLKNKQAIAQSLDCHICIEPCYASRL